MEDIYQITNKNNLGAASSSCTGQYSGHCADFCTKGLDCNVITSPGNLSSIADMDNIIGCQNCGNQKGCLSNEFGGWDPVRLGAQMSQFCFETPVADLTCCPDNVSSEYCTNMLSNCVEGDWCRMWRDNPCFPKMDQSGQCSNTVLGGTSCNASDIAQGVMSIYDDKVESLCHTQTDNPACDCVGARFHGHPKHHMWMAWREALGADRDSSQVGSFGGDKCWFKPCRTLNAEVDGSRHYRLRGQLCQDQCCKSCGAQVPGAKLWDNPDPCNFCTSIRGVQGDNDGCCPKLPDCSNIVISLGTTTKVENITQISDCSGEDHNTYWVAGHRGGDPDNWACKMVRQCDVSKEGCPEGTPPLPGGEKPPHRLSPSDFFAVPGGYDNYKQWGPDHDYWNKGCCAIGGDSRNCGQLGYGPLKMGPRETIIVSIWIGIVVWLVARKLFGDALGF